MADTTFVDGVTLTAADWFNDVNRLHYTILGDPATEDAVRKVLWKEASATASGATVTMPTNGNFFHITGTTTITAFSSSTAGYEFVVVFDGALTLTHNATSLILPGGENILTAAGDVARFVHEDTSGNVRCLDYVRKDRNPAGVTQTNRIINGSFTIDQRVNSATSRSDDTYCLDRWYVLTQTAAIQATQQAAQENGQEHNIRLTQNQAGAQRMGLAQIILGHDTISDRGQSMVLSGRVRISNSQAVRYAILEWTGTAGSVTSDVVNDWTSSTYTAGNFFLGANLTITAVGSITPTANVWTNITPLTGTLGSAVNNLVVFFWTEGTAAQNVTLDIGKVQLERGTTPTPFEITPWVLTYTKCLHFYEHSFPYGTAPAQSAGADGCGRFPQVVGASTAQFAGLVPYKVQKRTAPTVTLYNPSAANAQARNISAGSDCSSTSVGANSHEYGFHWTCTTPGGTSAGQTLGVHWTADSEL